MLRRSTSFDTRPMPMNTAMNSPNTVVAASPRSLMILTSWPAVSCPITYDAPIIRIANSTRLYRTLSRTDSRNTLTAMAAVAFIVYGSRGPTPARSHSAPRLRRGSLRRLARAAGALYGSRGTFLTARGAPPPLASGSRLPSLALTWRRGKILALWHDVGRGDALDEEVLEGVANRIQRHEVRASSGELGQQLLGRRLER